MLAKKNRCHSRYLKRIDNITEIEKYKKSEVGYSLEFSLIPVEVV